MLGFSQLNKESRGAVLMSTLQREDFTHLGCKEKGTTAEEHRGVRCFWANREDLFDCRKFAESYCLGCEGMGVLYPLNPQ